MKLSNIQLRILLPIIAREWAENPNAEVRFLLDKFVDHSLMRGQNDLVEETLAGIGIEPPTTYSIATATPPRKAPPPEPVVIGDQTDVRDQLRKKAAELNSD